jgi:uncharacterized small protein (DUF1192 family)
MKGEMMKEKSQEEKLDYALKQLDDNLLLWGIDNDSTLLREPRSTVARDSVNLSLSSVINLVALVNTLNAEVERLNTIIEEKSVS